MKKKHYIFILLSCAFFLFSQEEGKILWKKKAAEGQHFSFLDQKDNPEYLEVLNTGITNGVPYANKLKFDGKGNSRSSALEFEYAYDYQKVSIDDDEYYFLSNGYYVKNEEKNGIKVFDSNNKEIFSKAIDASSLKECYLLKDLLLVNTFSKNKKSALYAYKIANGDEVYKIDYVLLYDVHRPKMYFDLNRIVILETGKNLSIYSMDEGKLINKIEGFGEKIHFYNFYRIDNDIYFLSVDPYQIAFLSLDTGRVISNIKYRKKSNIDSLNNVVVEKYGGYYYLFLQWDRTNSCSLLCINTNTAEIVWDKSFTTTRRLTAFKKDNNAFITDKDNVYCIDLKTGREVWKVESKSITDSIMIEDLFLVENDKGMTNTAYDLETGTVKWEAKSPEKNVITRLIKEKHLVIADKTKLQNIEIKTGKNLWTNDSLKNIVYFDYDEDDRKFFVFYNKTQGIAEVDFDTGRTVWKLETEWDMVDITRSGDAAYFADRNNIYGINIRTGEVFLKQDLKLGSKISAICYLKSQKKVAIFDSKRGFFLFNPDTKAIDVSIDIASKTSNTLMFAEIKTMANYALITQISRATSIQGGIIPSRTYLTVVDLKSNKRLNLIRIGYHYYTDLGDFKDWYYEKHGVYYASEEMYTFAFYTSYIDYRRFIFFPRVELYKEGIVLVHPTGKKEIEAYQMFPSDACPTDADIKNSEAYFLTFNKR
ncbi:MAG: PQQ-binding-like beta-propeller repeat protein [Spirochaetes bacterium]|nr:PQQ-binding-like beta-propeller repeat protein [Spirochaetota bacterium]